MNNPQRWFGLSVQEFLSQANWDGRSFQAPNRRSVSPVIVGSSMKDWGGMSVEAFFKANNWMGLPIDWEGFSPSEETFIPSYTAAVQHFFQYLPWEGQPAIAHLPKIAPPANRLHPAHPEDNLTLVDLSDLF